jgi:hypothetical protein
LNYSPTHDAYIVYIDSLIDIADYIDDKLYISISLFAIFLEFYADIMSFLFSNIKSFTNCTAVDFVSES